MKRQHLFGIVFLIAAAILLYLATDVQSLSEQMGNVFAGRFGERTTQLFGAGVASAMIGVFLMVTTSRARRA